jgi:oligopeptide/dipeptide ABC transporter ATP-binding protein
MSAAAEGPGKSNTAAEGPGKSNTAAEGPGKSNTAAEGPGQSNAVSKPDSTALLHVSRLRVEYPVPHRPPFRAVDNVTLTIAPGETVGLVGESGSGKTTIANTVLGFVPPAAGTITFDGHDITRVTGTQRRQLSALLQVVFQDPYSSLNPARTIGQTLTETLRPHGSRPKPRIAERVAAILDRVGLDPAAAGRYPSQFSGGQRQRIAIARALIIKPRLVICDEPVSSLDLSVQAQVLNLLRSLQDELGVSYLFISHDLAVIRHISTRIIVLYQGRVMEAGPAATVCDHPIHPYTRALLQSVPVPNPELQRARRASRQRGTPGPADTVKPESCQFAPRCPLAADICRQQQPQQELTGDGSLVACHRWRELSPRGTRPPNPLAGLPA